MNSRLRVLIRNQQSKVKIPTGLRLLIRRCCAAVLTLEGLDDIYEVSVSFVDNDQIRKLNHKYRNIDMPTDVLSFPLSENGKYDYNPDTGAKMLGDIVLSMERAQTQAEDFGHSIQREVGYLVAHSMLHLLGYDHETNGLEAVHMREKEEAVMTQLGLPRDASYVMADEE